MTKREYVSHQEYQTRMKEILEFCEEPKSSTAIREHFRIGEQATLRCIRILKASGHLDKITVKGKPNGHGVTFEWTGKNYEATSRAKPVYNSGFTILGVRF